MRKIILFTLVNALLSTVLFGQECNNEKDAFTGEQKCTFDYKPSNIPYLHLEVISDIRTIEFRAVENSAINYTIPKGSEILIKLDNGEIIQLFLLKDVSSSVGVASASGFSATYSEYFLKAEITVSQLQKLASFNITDLRYPNLHGGNRDEKAKDLRKGFRQAFMKGAKCILGEK